ncbi:MAG: hypothetical protein LKF71_04830 [Oscillospiraceae bacterium]|jgi:hypothetical protein|nr:hypothetical protein [Oscillospiraceae bacterium]
MLKNTQNKVLNYLDLFLAHLSGGKKRRTPTHSSYLHTAILTGSMAVLLVVLLVLDEWSLTRTSFGIDVPLLIITLLLAAVLSVCAVRSIQLSACITDDEEKLR